MTSPVAGVTPLSAGEEEGLREVVARTLKNHKPRNAVIQAEYVAALFATLDATRAELASLRAMTNLTTEHVEPCSCGSAASVRDNIAAITNPLFKGSCYVRCDLVTCGARGPWKAGFAEAIAAWNKVAAAQRRADALERERDEEVAEYNAGYACAERGGSISEEPKTKHDHWLAGFKARDYQRLERELREARKQRDHWRRENSDNMERAAIEKRELLADIKEANEERESALAERNFARQDQEAAEARCGELRDLLEWLDRKGGLGLDVHERIGKALRDSAPLGERWKAEREVIEAAKALKDARCDSPDRCNVKHPGHHSSCPISNATVWVVATVDRLRRAEQEGNDV